MSLAKHKGSKKARLTMARLAAVQCVYQWLQTGTQAKDILDYYENYFTGLRVEEEEMLPPDRDLLATLLQGVQDQLGELDAIVKSNIKKDGQLVENKKDLIILSVLYCGAYELLFYREYDPPLIISEYLHITRSFYDDSEVKLVNGVLDGIKSTLDC